MSGEFSFDQLARLIGDRNGIRDVACPACGPERRHPKNRKRRVLRIWREEPSFLTYRCARCEQRGYAHDSTSNWRPDPSEIARRMADAEKDHAAHVKRRSEVASWLWGQSVPIENTPAATYLRARGILNHPATLRALPARGQHGPAMIAVFGIPAEPEPGILDVSGVDVGAIHITKLRADGTGKAPDAEGRAKIMIGPSVGLPIVLAPANDIGGLAITEGIEDALSLHQSTGLGAWAAGSANRLPQLAGAVPPYVESVMVAVDDDEAGRRHADELAANLKRVRRDLDITMSRLGSVRRAAA